MAGRRGSGGARTMGPMNSLQSSLSLKTFARLGTETFFVTLGLALLAWFYLLPASRELLAGNASSFLSNGTDTLTTPAQMDMLIRAFHERPSLLFYGAVHTAQLDPPHGVGLWFPWIDRILILSGSRVLPVAALPTFYGWALMVLNGLAFHAFARFEGWKKPLCFALSIAFTFNPYVRTRLAVHPALAAIYFLPLVFLAIRLIQRKRGAWSLIVAAVSLIAALTTAHYYWMILIALLPFLIFICLWRQKEWKLLLGRAALASIPALLFLGWNALVPLPSDLRARAAVQSPPPRPYFLVQFAARPIDYLAGDLMMGTRDLNPLRAEIGRNILAHLDTSNPWERTNGIRWSLLLLFLGITVIYARSGSRQKAFDLETRIRLGGFLLFTFGAFWISLSPRSLAPGGHGIGPSLWVHWLLPNLRVPSRFGPAVHFGVLLIAGTGLDLWLRRNRAPALLWLLPALMVLDYAPLEPMPMRALLPNLSPIEEGRVSHCGVGLFLPTLSGVEIGPDGEVETYSWFQKLRGTSCALLGGAASTDSNAALRAEFAQVPGNLADEKHLMRFIDCAQISWIGLSSKTQPADRSRLCQEIGFEIVAPDLCRSTMPRQLNPHWHDCLP